MAAEYGPVPGSVPPEAITPEVSSGNLNLPQVPVEANLSIAGDNIDLTQARPIPPLEQERIISSSPGLEVVELPVERYIFGNFSIRREEHKKLLEENPQDFSDHAMQIVDNELGAAREEYRAHLRDRERGIVHKQRIWVHKYPSWNASLRKENVIDLDSRRTESPQMTDESKAETETTRKIA